MHSPKEIKIAKSLQGHIPLTKRPYRSIGKKLVLEEADVITAIKNMQDKGVIRKFSAIVKHQQAGYTINAMVIWAVPPPQCEAVGSLFAAYPEITHCYERTPPFEGKYNIFCMVHCRESGLTELIGKLSEASSITDYQVLTSEEEFKKSSMEYF
jgi:DNA-binding Lrp family transcriptional regulator